LLAWFATVILPPGGRNFFRAWPVRTYISL